ncbi:uncharacterized protein LOC142986388 isoform X1 [Anticarsia gemmatalis]|uniref:uncharacterized protein LOC142986388 isoform X1 n=1 Tax=Anticarsia gemmatalis TaxID=129554 RepID=UPI003F75D03E
MAKQDDGLFLLEVLIDKIVFVKSPCFSDKDFRTCVNIQCPSVEPLEICDDDPGSCIAKSGGPFVKTFNSGKSCLFSLHESDINKAMSSFPVHVTVFKSLPCGCLPTKIIMGEATIDMTKEFVQSRKKFLEDPTNVSYEALKDSFRIVGPDKAETGEVVMFLRISCFGKLIITRFQGASGPPNLGTGGGGSSIVDRSCLPRKDFQTTDDPCVCGAARGAAGPSGPSGPCTAPCKSGGQVKGFGVCPPAPDPYNSMPCEDPDDPCFCSGPKPPKPQQMVCRNTEQYCLHVPKGGLPSLPLSQDSKEDRITEVNTAKELTFLHSEDRFINLFKVGSSICSETMTTFDEFLTSSLERLQFSTESFLAKEDLSMNPLYTVSSKRRSVSFSNKIDYGSKSYNKFPEYQQFVYNRNIPRSLFGTQEMSVYMTLFNEFCRHRTSGTQATASLNKCLQVSANNACANDLFTSTTNSNYCSSCLLRSPINSKKYFLPEQYKYSDIYFFGRKHDDAKKFDKMGMGATSSRSKLRRSSSQQYDKSIAASASVQARTPSSTTGAQTRSLKGNSQKAVSIKESCSRQCPSVPACAGGSNGKEMTATVSHIKIGPKEPCPIYGMGPCQGPKCMVASPQDAPVPVKISTVTNPRRGVFELVIRRITGAPLARNELMLEWTPPPSRPPPCGVPCPTPCAVPICRPPKCKMVICRPPKCCSKPCRKPCGPPCRPCGPAPCKPAPCKPACRPSCRPKPCRPAPCRPPPCRPARCRPPPCRPSPCGPLPCRPPPCGGPCRPPPCGRPCRPACVVPCRPPPCRRVPCKRCCKSTCCAPCPPPPCVKPCCRAPCTPPCTSSPCLRPCPVGYKRPRKCRSQPKIKGHRKRTSPCCNRSKSCPVARCRSGPCIGCCGTRLCPPRKCCKVFPCISQKCCTIGPKCCKSNCSSCC